MEISNSTDISRKRSRRVRSWYLYEQFKSLENNQSEAAQKLKDRSYQERILFQELSERRARRRLCDQFGLCQSESRIDRSLSHSPSKSILSSSTDNLYESFCKLHTEDDIGDACSCDGSQSSKLNEECKADLGQDISRENSVESVVPNLKFDDSLTDNIKGDLQSIKRDIAENINLQLETVKENIECLEKYTKRCDEGRNIEEDSFASIETCLCDFNAEDLKKFQLDCKEQDCNILNVWSKLVRFSHSHLMQLSSGNCYDDYSTQLLTAVLICDVVRRGLNKMCYYLQPYVSPIKYAPSDEDLFQETRTGSKKNAQCKILMERKCPSHKISHTQPVSEKKWYSFENNRNETKLHELCKLHSEPVKRTEVLEDCFNSEQSSNSIWPNDIGQHTKSECKKCKCVNIKRLVNSMIQLSRCLDATLCLIQTSNCC